MTRLRSGHGPHRATYRQRRSITGHTVPPSGTGRSPITHLSHNEHDLAGWGEAPLALLEHRQDVACRIAEPGNVRPSTTADALLVLRRALVTLEPHPAGGQLIDGLVDAVDREVQDRVGRGRVIGLRDD